RQVRPKPTGEQHHQQANQNQNQDVAVQDWLMQDPELEIILCRGRNALGPRGQALWQIVINDDCSHYSVGLRRCVDRSRPSNYVGVSETISSGHRLTLKRL